MVSFILLRCSSMGRICIQKLNGSGLSAVSNLMHLGSSRSMMCSFTAPIGVVMAMESVSNVSPLSLSAGRRSFTLSILLKSLSKLYTLCCE